jgi:hypothetical protein
MFNIVKQVLNFQNNLYIVERIIRETCIKEQCVMEYKNYLMCDSVLKKDGMYYFVNKIDEAQIIEEKGQLKLDL